MRVRLTRPARFGTRAKLARPCRPYRRSRLRAPAWLPDATPSMWIRCCQQHVPDGPTGQAGQAGGTGHSWLTYDEGMPVKTRRVLVAKPRGYCAGVDRAVQAVEVALEL